MSIEDSHFKYDMHAKPIWEEISDIVSTLPKEVFDKLPVDGAEKHDYYLYGDPNNGFQNN